MASEFAKWFPSCERVEAPKLRILCIPNAGSSEAIFTSRETGIGRANNVLASWAHDNGVEVLAAQLPGREERRGEVMLSSCEEVAAHIFRVIRTELESEDCPVALVAHSIGTWIGFELMCLMRDAGLKPPIHTFFSAFPPPTCTDCPWVSTEGMSDAQFKNECEMWDANALLFSEPSWSLYAPLLRADYGLLNSHKPAHAGTPFASALTLFWASRDRRITREHVEGWKELFAHSAGMGQQLFVRVRGHHMFPYDEEGRAMWFKSITSTLKRHVMSAPTSLGAGGAGGMRRVTSMEALAASGFGTTASGGGGRAGEAGAVEQQPGQLPISVQKLSIFEGTDGADPAADAAALAAEEEQAAEFAKQRRREMGRSWSVGSAGSQEGGKQQVLKCCWVFDTSAWLPEEPEWNFALSLLPDASDRIQVAALEGEKIPIRVSRGALAALLMQRTLASKVLGASGAELPAFRINGGILDLSSVEAAPVPAGAAALWERVRDNWKFELQQLDSAQIACVVHGPKSAEADAGDEGSSAELAVKLESRLVHFDTDLVPVEREAELNALLYGDAGF